MQDPGGLDRALTIASVVGGSESGVVIAASSTGVSLPIVAALIGAAVGFLGAGGMRLVLDRRQELVRAQAHGRVILEELRGIAERLSPELEVQNPLLATAELPTDAWHSNRTEIASVVLHEEFLALSMAYRAVAFVNGLSSFLHELWSSGGAHPIDPDAIEIPEDMRRERHNVRLIIEGLAIPSVEWLATGNLRFFRRRRAHMTLTPSPDEPCRCGHRWDVHRWKWRRRWLRLRWHSYTVRSAAYECNREGCTCRRFRWAAASFYTRPLRRLNLLPPAPYLGMDEPEPPPPPDRSIPETAWPGRIVTDKDEAEIAEMTRRMQEQGGPLPDE
jgi:hypothetical protein